MGRHGQGSFDTIKRGERVYHRFRITIDGRTIERVSISRKKLDAEAKKLRARASAHLIGNDEEITLEHWALDRWLPAKELELGTGGAYTIRNYRSALDKHILPVLGRVKVRDLRATHRRKLQTSLVAKGLKTSTVNAIDGVLKACLQSAANDELPVVVSAITAVRAVKAMPEKKPVLSTDNVQAILTGAAGGDWWALWVCFACTGARDAEVRGLRWEDWDQHAGTLTFRRQLPQNPGDPPRWQNWIKGRKAERVVPVVPLLAQALREQRVRQNAARLKLGRMWCDYGLVFPDEVGRALPAYRVNRQFTAAVKAAGVATWKGLGVHALRHAANNAMRELGTDTPLRAQVLGHTSEVNERTYTAGNLKLAADALGKMAQNLGF